MASRVCMAVYKHRDTLVPRKHHADYQITKIEATGVQLKLETYIEWFISLTFRFIVERAPGV